MKWFDCFSESAKKALLHLQRFIWTTLCVTTLVKTDERMSQMNCELTENTEREMIISYHEN